MNSAVPTRRPRSPCCLLALFALTAACTLEDANKTAGRKPDTTTVKRGPLTISFKETAELQAARETRVRSDMEGNNTVIYLIPEGTRVNAGDKLVELDASQVIERKATQEIAVAKADAALVNARKELEIQLKQIDADMLAANNKVKIAFMEQEKFLGRLEAEGARQMGEREQQEKDAVDTIKLSEQEVKLAEDRLAWSTRLQGKEYITKNELERDMLDAERKRYQLTRSRNTLKLLQDYDLKIKDLEVEQKVREAELERDRVRAQGEARKAQAEAEVASREAEFRLAKERLDNLLLQEKNAVLRAPTPGLVVHAFEGDGMRRREVVEEGAQVRQRQTLIVLPDVTRMVALLSVHEAIVDKIAVGQRADVRVDAFPDERFEGIVTTVAPLPDSGSRGWGSNPNLKVYKTTVELQGENKVLRPGMSATCEIVLAVHDDVTYLPIQAVQRAGNVAYVWLDETPPRAQIVQLGANDYVHVEIKDGVQAGAEVLLAPPAGVPLPEFAAQQGPEPPKREVPPAEPRPPEPDGNGGNGRVTGNGNGSPRPEGNGGEGAEGGPPPGTRPDRPRPTSPEAEEFMTLFRQKFPELAAKADAAGGGLMGLWRDPEARAAIEGDAELKEKRDALMQSFGRGRGNRGNREGGGRRGGDGGGPGSRGEGGQGPRGERGDGGGQSPRGDRSSGGAEGGARDPR
jgi:HlyD family secretion protein